MRKEQIRRLRESMQKKKEENLKNLEKEIKELEELALLKNIDKYQFEEAIMTKGFSSNEEVQKRINKIFLKLNLDKKEEEKLDEEKRWPLLNIPDEDLMDEQIKMKRIQKMQKNAYLTRLEKREVSKREKEIVGELKLLGYKTIHSYRVDSKICDVFIPSLNLIIEYFGDYWHCNPKKYEPDYFNKKKNKFAWELWDYDKKKIDLIKSYGYNLEVVWEGDLKFNNKLIELIIENYVTKLITTP